MFLYLLPGWKWAYRNNQQCLNSAEFNGSNNMVNFMLIDYFNFKQQSNIMEMFVRAELQLNRSEIQVYILLLHIYLTASLASLLQI